MSRVGSVVLVDDDDDARAATRQLLELSGFAVEAFGEARRALERLRTDQDSIVITDIRMPGMSGLDLLAELRRRDAALPVILITGHGDVDTAVAALKGGAWDFLTKPFDPDLLVAAARRAAEARALTIDN
ncbi:response regulator, partial [Endobacter medicaginis]